MPTLEELEARVSARPTPLTLEELEARAASRPKPLTLEDLEARAQGRSLLQAAHPQQKPLTLDDLEDRAAQRMMLPAHGPPKPFLQRTLEAPLGTIAAPEPVQRVMQALNPASWLPGLAGVRNQDVLRGLAETTANLVEGPAAAIRGIPKLNPGLALHRALVGDDADQRRTMSAILDTAAEPFEVMAQGARNLAERVPAREDTPRSMWDATSPGQFVRTVGQRGAEMLPQLGAAIAANAYLGPAGGLGVLGGMEAGAAKHGLEAGGLDRYTASAWAVPIGIINMGLERAGGGAVLKGMLGKTGARNAVMGALKPVLFEAGTEGSQELPQIVAEVIEDLATKPKTFLEGLKRVGESAFMGGIMGTAGSPGGAVGAMQARQKAEEDAKPTTEAPPGPKAAMPGTVPVTPRQQPPPPTAQIGSRKDFVAAAVEAGRPLEEAEAVATTMEPYAKQWAGNTKRDESEFWGHVIGQLRGVIEISDEAPAAAPPQPVAPPSPSVPGVDLGPQPEPFLPEGEVPDTLQQIKGYHGTYTKFAPEEGAPHGRFRDEKLRRGARGFGHHIASREAEAKGYFQPGGALYKGVVQKYDDEHFLDLDAPLVEQGPAVKAILGEMGFDQFAMGQEIYDSFVKEEGTPEKASARLRGMGIPGSMFYDSLSTSPEGGQRNYIVFSGADLEIQEPSLLQRPGQKDAGVVRGRITFDSSKKAVIELSRKHANPSTLAHEVSHVFRRFLRENDNEIADLANQWVGAKNDNWTVAQEEQWARTYERWLAEGANFRLPGRSLKFQERLTAAFKLFQRWMQSVYGDLEKSELAGYAVTPEIRQVFERMMGGQKPTATTAQPGQWTVPEERKGSPVSVKFDDGRRPARVTLVDVSDLKVDAEGYQNRLEEVSNKKAVDYAGDKGEFFDPEEFFSTHPRPQLGMPVVDPSNGALISANTRMKALKIALANALPRANYLAALKEEMQAHGLSPALLEGMNAPVLVRVLEEPFASKKETAELLKDKEPGESPKSLMQKSPAPIWKSKLDDVVNQKMGGSMPVVQLKAFLAAAGVTKAEREWRLDDLLEGKERVTKAEVLQHLRENEVDVQEVQLTDTVLPEEARRDSLADAVQRAEDDLRAYEVNLAEGGEAEGDYRAEKGRLEGILRDAERQLREHDAFVDFIYNRPPRVRPRHSKPQYGPSRYPSLNIPGGENYREVFVTAPSQRRPKERAAKIELIGTHGAENVYEVTDSRGTHRIIAPDAKSAELANSPSPTPSKNWRDGHPAYDDITNPIARVRFDERTDTDGKRMLFIQEVQPPSEAEQAKMPQWARDRWREIAMKRMVRWAADNGFDRIGWTTGEQQAKRYDLSKQISRLFYKANDDGTVSIRADLQNGGQHEFGDSIPAAKVENYVGKELAGRISRGEGGASTSEKGYRFFKDADLKVGGEGLKRVYDADIPAVLDKIGKKHGAKAGKGELEGHWTLDGEEIGGGPIHSFDIPDSLKAEAQQGFSLFQKGKAKKESPEALLSNTGIVSKNLLYQWWRWSARMSRGPHQWAEKYPALKEYADRVEGAWALMHGTLIPHLTLGLEVMLERRSWRARKLAALMGEWGGGEKRLAEIKDPLLKKLLRTVAGKSRAATIANARNLSNPAYKWIMENFGPWYETRNTKARRPDPPPGIQAEVDEFAKVWEAYNAESARLLTLAGAKTRLTEPIKDAKGKVITWYKDFEAWDTKHYIPHVPTEEVMDALDQGEASPLYLALKAWGMDKKSGDQEDKKWVLKWLENRELASKAPRWLHERGRKGLPWALIVPGKNGKKGRLVKILKTDMDTLLHHQREVARKLGIIRFFGAENELLTVEEMYKKVTKAGKTGTMRASTAKNVIGRSWKRLLGHDQGWSDILDNNPTLKNILWGADSVTAASLLSMAWVTQLLGGTGVAMEVGVLPTVKAFTRSFTTRLDSKLAREMRAKGAVLKNVVQAAAMTEGVDWLAKGWSKFWLERVTPMQNLNAHINLAMSFMAVTELYALGAAVAESKSKSWFGESFGPGWSKETAIRYMKERLRFTDAEIKELAAGLTNPDEDAKGIPEHLLKKAVYKMQEIYNAIHESPAEKGEFANIPMVRWVARFSSMLRKLADTSNFIISEAQHGNVGPLARMLVVGVPMAEFVRWLKDWLDDRKDEGGFWGGLLEDIMELAMFGYWSKLAYWFRKDDKEVKGLIEALIGPPTLGAMAELMDDGIKSLLYRDPRRALKGLSSFNPILRRLYRQSVKAGMSFGSKGGAVGDWAADETARRMRTMVYLGDEKHDAGDIRAAYAKTGKMLMDRWLASGRTKGELVERIRKMNREDQERREGK